MDLLSQKETFPSGLKDEIGAAWEDLQVHLEPKPGYIPRFIQRKIQKVVSNIERFYQTTFGDNWGTGTSTLGEEDWLRIEKRLGKIISQVREAGGTIPVKEDDFRNLLVMREKLQLWAPTLASTFQERGLDFKLDSISRVNTTSGYVWVAFITNRKHNKVEQGSYCLTFTPQHLRAGMEMGGRSREVRETYYQKLLQGELDHLLSELVQWDGKFIDTFWYFNIREVVAIRDWLKEEDIRKRFGQKIKQARQFLSQENIYTWNILLPGCLIPPDRFSREAEAVTTLITNLAETTRKILSQIQ